MNKMTTCLWFDNKAEEAAKFYKSVFKDNAKIDNIVRYPEGAPGKPGSVMTVQFSINGQNFLGLNGGPVFNFNESVSFMINCKDQKEIDYYWNALLKDGKESQCGWLKDKYGVSWQIVPANFAQWYTSKDKEKSKRVMAAMMKMIKLDIKTLQAAFDGPKK